MTTPVLETGPMLRRAIQQGLDTGQRAVCPWCGERELIMDSDARCVVLLELDKLGFIAKGTVHCEACGLEYQEEIHR